MADKELPNVVEGGRYTDNCNSASNNLLVSNEGQSNTRETADNEDFTSTFIGDQLPSRSASLEEILSRAMSHLSPPGEINSESTSTAATRVLSPEPPVSTLRHVTPSTAPVVPYKRKAPATLAKSQSSWSEVHPAFQRAKLFGGLGKQWKKGKGKGKMSD